MALQNDALIEGEEGTGPIDLEASLARLRAMLEAVDDAQHSTVTLRLSPLFSVRQRRSGPGGDPQGQLSRVWSSREWIVRQPDDPEELRREAGATSDASLTIIASHAVRRVASNGQHLSLPRAEWEAMTEEERKAWERL